MSRSTQLRLAIGPSEADEALLARLRPRLSPEVSGLLEPGERSLSSLAADRVELAASLTALGLAAAEQQAALLALHRHLDLAIALRAERVLDDAIARTERLALLGQIAGSIGHELRNPLGVIDSSLYLLRARPDDFAVREKHLSRIGEQTKLASQIVSDLLALIDERNTRPGADEPFAVALLVDDALGVLGEVAIPVGKEDLSGLPLVRGDRGQLRQALRNLLDNACRAARTSVQLRARAITDFVEIIVDDDGVGVAPTLAAQLFEPLMTTRPDGLGLGLALVRHIADRNGGSVRHEPTSTGARFVLSLRRAEIA
jgi:two-component system, NtrC family, sensor histidine kinase HydH